MLQRLRYLATIALMIGALEPCAASIILVQNPGFEEMVDLPFGSSTMGIGPFNFDSIPGWVAATSGNSGIFRPNQPPITGSVLTLPDGFGSQTLFIGTPGVHRVYQNLGVLVREGITYTLSVDIGDRTNTPLGGVAGGGSIGLFTTSGVSLAVKSFNGSFVQNGWARLSTTFTADSLFAGQELRIQFSSNGQQTNFDNVKVDAVPEPSTISVWSVGCVVVVINRRRPPSA
jgi:hypothetical protein